MATNLIFFDIFTAHIFVHSHSRLY